MREELEQTKLQKAAEIEALKSGQSSSKELQEKVWEISSMKSCEDKIAGGANSTAIYINQSLGKEML